VSAETLTWLRENIRIGFTDERGPAWWANKANGEYMTDGTHFDGPVPVEEVKRLLDVKLVSGPVSSVFTDGSNRIPVVDPERQSIIRVHDAGTADARGEILGVFKSGYRIHGYDEWINKALSTITDSNLETAAVALLRKGAVAFHQVKLPEQWEVGGFAFTPWFTGATSCDGSLLTTWFTGVDAAVCDNTFEMARQGAQTRVGFKHTRNSCAKMEEARSTLGLTLKAGEDFAAMAEELQAVEVSDKDFDLWLDEMVPMPEAKSADKPGRGYTIAENKREAMRALWLHDPKVQPWNGTGFGLLQLDNTWRTWERTVQVADGGRMERNMLNLTLGKTADDDSKALAALKSVQERKLVIA
jgi:phage/plasmid-like protein (TIGR03299 family)